MNVHSVAKLYFIKDDPANVRRSSVFSPVQKIISLNLFAAFLCDKSEDFTPFFIRQLEILICAIKVVPFGHCFWLEWEELSEQVKAEWNPYSDSRASRIFSSKSIRLRVVKR
jgi:hypothetical protein